MKNMDTSTFDVKNLNPELEGNNQAHLLSQQVLRTDVSGMPLEWVSYQDAARLHHLGQVSYYFGSLMYELRGGTNAISGQRTTLPVHSIIATYGNSKALNKIHDYVPPLNNQTLFKRDAHLCLYCGKRFQKNQLSRDHVKPLSQGGFMPNTFF